MYSDIIKSTTREYLKRLARGEVKIPPELIDEYMTYVRKRTGKEHSPNFTLRMSNLGKPLCQLQLEKAKVVKVPLNEYQRQFTFMMGDMSELWLIMIMKAAGVPVQSFDVSASLIIEDQNIKGTADIVIMDTVYDIKTISSTSFNKYSNAFGGFSAFVDDDPFGYLEQGFVYAKALGIPFGGWILINKNTGEIDVCDTPLNYEEYADAALKRAAANVRAITDNVPFKRQFNDEPEYFKKELTGNRILGKTCTWCDFRTSCWPTAVYRPSIVSAAKSPPMVAYTEINVGGPDVGA